MLNPAFVPYGVLSSNDVVEKNVTKNTSTPTRIAVLARLKNTEISMLNAMHVKPYRKNIRKIRKKLDFGNNDHDVIAVAMIAMKR